jgi:Txe/YoeB family toxin of Txe-Axe toxin-antitoxin module
MTLIGALVAQTYSRLISMQHHLMCQIFEKQKAVKIIRMWTQCE